VSTSAGSGGVRGGVMRRGVRLGVDVGTVRIGLARSDPDGLLATPIRTLTRPPAGPPGRHGADAVDRADLDQIAALVGELEVIEVVVGLPLRLGGETGPAAEAARRYAEAVARRVAPVGVRLVDERLSTVTATRALRDAGRRQRRARPVVDQAAAVVILQAALDSERATGRVPGVPVDGGETRPSARRDRQEQEGGGGSSGAGRAEAAPS